METLFKFVIQLIKHGNNIKSTSCISATTSLSKYIFGTEIELATIKTMYEHQIGIYIIICDTTNGSK